MHPNPNPKCCHYPHFIDGQTETPRVKSCAQGHRWSQTAVPRWTSSPAGSPVYSHRGRWEVFICKAGLWTVPMHCCKGTLSVPPPTPTPSKRCQIQTLRQTEKYRPTDQHRLILKKTLLPPHKNLPKELQPKMGNHPSRKGPFRRCLLKEGK